MGEPAFFRCKTNDNACNNWDHNKGNVVWNRLTQCAVPINISVAWFDLDSNAPLTCVTMGILVFSCEAL
jgi:hypothetical protein